MKLIYCFIVSGIFLACCNQEEKKYTSKVLEVFYKKPMEDEVTIYGDTIKWDETYFDPANIYVTVPNAKRLPNSGIVIKKTK